MFETNSLLSQAPKHLVLERAENLIKLHKNHLMAYEASVDMHDFTVYKDVFCPEYGEGSRLLVEVVKNLNIKLSDNILELGAGSGAVSVLLSDSNKSNKVVSTDISPYAIECISFNAKRYGVEIDIRRGDLFDVIKKNKLFSIILFNPPFMNGIYSDWLERAMYDPDYKTLSLFFSEASKYLSKNGKIYLAFSNCGDMKLFKKILSSSIFNYSVFLETTEKGISFFVLELDFIGNPP